MKAFIVDEPRFEKAILLLRTEADISELLKTIVFHCNRLTSINLVNYKN